MNTRLKTAGAIGGLLATWLAAGCAARAGAHSSSPRGGALTIATLVAWVTTASLGGFMLTRWIGRGGRREKRPPGSLSPMVIYWHFGLAITGLAVWTSFVLTGVAALAWVAACVLMPVTGLGISTVTLWTPYPNPGVSVTGMLKSPSEDVISSRLTDATLTRALSDEALARRLVEEVLAGMPETARRPARRQRGYLTALIPVGHGLAAIATILLAMVTLATIG